MKPKDVEKLYKAFRDSGLELKHLNVEDYMKAIKLNKKLTEFVTEASETVVSLIKDYNKNYFEAFDKLNENPSDNKKALEDLIAQGPPVKAENGNISGPVDVIEKINKLNEEEFTYNGLNFIEDVTVFKLVTEKTSAQNQLVFFTYLFKQ